MAWSWPLGSAAVDSGVWQWQWRVQWCWAVGNVLAVGFSASRACTVLALAAGCAVVLAVGVNVVQLSC